MSSPRDSTPSSCVALSAAGCEPAVISDEQREQLIEHWRAIVEIDPDSDVKNVAALRMAALIRERSPAQVRRMEEARGLR
jgi:hypothetical protein